MSRWFWVVLSVAISTAVYFTIRYGLRPKPIPVLDPTEFQNPQQVGTVVYTRLKQTIRQERLMVIGSDPRLAGNQQIWTGFLQAAVSDGVKVDVLFFNKEFSPPAVVPSSWQTVSFTQADVASGELIKQVQARLQQGHMVVVNARTQATTHLVDHSLSRKLELIAHHPVLAISTLPFAIQPGEEDDLATQCLNPVAEHKGENLLGCAALRVSKKFLKMRLTPSKIWAVVEQHGLKEYLIFIHHS